MNNKTLARLRDLLDNFTLELFSDDLQLIIRAKRLVEECMENR